MSTQTNVKTHVLAWEESEDLRDPANWNSGAKTTYTVRLFHVSDVDRLDEIDQDGFDDDENVDVESPQPYDAAEARLMARHGIDPAQCDREQPW